MQSQALININDSFVAHNGRLLAIVLPNAQRCVGPSRLPTLHPTCGRLRARNTVRMHTASSPGYEWSKYDRLGQVHRTREWSSPLSPVRYRAEVPSNYSAKDLISVCVRRSLIGSFMSRGPPSSRRSRVSSRADSLCHTRMVIGLPLPAECSGRSRLAFIWKIFREAQQPGF